jgi:hypothetical protein
MNTPPFDLAVAQRWFAVELNNLAWDLVEATTLSEAQAQRMIHAAHAACYFWLEAGDVLNHLRAQNLLATAYAKAGLGERAVYHAETCVELSLEAGDRQTDFDRAVAYGCAALAYRVAGKTELAEKYFPLARELAWKLRDADEKSVFDRLYGGT